jgi:hypothetical protein
VIAHIQSQNFKFCTIELEAPCVWTSEKMKEDLQIYDKVIESRRLEAFAVNRCMYFFIGLMKRFGYTNEPFLVPLEQKSKSKPLRFKPFKETGD